MKKAKLITISGLVLSAVLLFVSLRGVDFREIGRTLQQADLRLLPVPLIFFAISLCLASFRWSKIAGSGTRFRDTFTALLIGLFVNNVLPARIGEVARGYVLSKRTRLSFTVGFSTVLLDRFFDLTGLLLITLIFMPRHSLPPMVYKALLLLVLLLLICVAGIILLSREGVARHVSGKLLSLEKSFLNRLAHRVIEIQENLKRISSPLMLVSLVLISFVSWMSMSTALYVVAVALGVPVSFSYIPFVCALLNMGLTVPSSPGYVGVYQFLLVYLLGIFGIPKTQAFTISILYHASWFIPYIVIGFLMLAREHLKIRDLRHIEE
jgi:uncharacterized protein (TIRG00374 family)